MNNTTRSRKLIITPDAIEWTDTELLNRNEIKTFTGTKRLIYQDNDFIGLRKNELQNCVLILDDFKAFGISSRKELEAFRYLAVRRRQMAIDIFIIAHGFTEVVPTFLFTFANTFILFKTHDNIDRVKNRLKDYEKLKEAQKRINNHENKHYKEIINI